MSRRHAAVAVAAAAVLGCSDLTAGDDGVASLEVRVPEPPSIEVGQTIQLTAQAFDKDGAVVSVPITWRTPDPATLTVGAETGLVTGVSPPSGRVQATAGSFTSDFVTINVVSPAAAATDGGRPRSGRAAVPAAIHGRDARATRSRRDARPTKTRSGWRVR